MCTDDLLQSDLASVFLASLEEEQRKIQQWQKFSSSWKMECSLRMTSVLISWLSKNTFVIVDQVLYHLDSKQDHSKQVVVPIHLWRQIMEETPYGPMSGHFSGQRLFNTLSITGSKKICLLTVVSSPRDVQNVPLYPVEEELYIQDFILLQRHDHSRLLVQISCTSQLRIWG